MVPPLFGQEKRPVPYLAYNGKPTVFPYSIFRKDEIEGYKQIKSLQDFHPHLLAKKFDLPCVSIVSYFLFNMFYCLLF